MLHGNRVLALRDYATRVFGIDLRALAAFRVLLGLTLLVYVITTALDFELLLTGRGVLPADAIWPLRGCGSAGATLRTLVDAPIGVAVLLGVMAAASLLLALGIRSRAATIVLWVGVGFLERRNPWIHNAQHAMVLFCLLWAMFLPIDARCALGGRRLDLRLQHVSPATVGLVLQVLFVYLTAGFSKSGPDWHSDADAIYLVAHTERLQTVFTPLLAALPDSVLAGLTRSIWCLEVFAPLALVSPLYFTRARTKVALLLILMHIGLGTFMRLGIFPLIAIAYLVTLLPRPFWDRLFPGSAAESHERRAEARFGSPAAHAVAALLVACMLASYLNSIPGMEGMPPAWMRRVAGEIRIGHVYRLFDRVSHSESRFLVLGRFENGATIDLLSKRPARVSWRPDSSASRPTAVSAFPGSTTPGARARRASSTPSSRARMRSTCAGTQSPARFGSRRSGSCTSCAGWRAAGRISSRAGTRTRTPAPTVPRNGTARSAWPR